MILWKISTAISIKHLILATFNIEKINLSDCMPLNGVTLPSNIVLATYSHECGKYELVAASVKTTMYNL